MLSRNREKREAYRELIEHLNALPPTDGWFTENYGGLPNQGRSAQADGLKRPWQIHNTRKLDAIREEIEQAVAFNGPEIGGADEPDPCS